MGWGDLACYGNETIKSPNLDHFAIEGVRFTQCYSACGEEINYIGFYTKATSSDFSLIEIER